MSQRKALINLPFYNDVCINSYWSVQSFHFVFSPHPSFPPSFPFLFPSFLLFFSFSKNVLIEVELHSYPPPLSSLSSLAKYFPTWQPSQADPHIDDLFPLIIYIYNIYKIIHIHTHTNIYLYMNIYDHIHTTIYMIVFYIYPHILYTYKHACTFKYICIQHTGCWVYFCCVCAFKNGNSALPVGSHRWEKQIFSSQNTLALSSSLSTEEPHTRFISFLITFLLIISIVIVWFCLRGRV